MHPNAGTVWAARPGEKEYDGRQVVEDQMRRGDPNRFTVFATPETPPDDPKRSPVYQDSENRNYLCKVCNHVCQSMSEFNKHHEIDPRGNGREMKCEVELRLRRGLMAPPQWSPESATDQVGPIAPPQQVIDPNAIASAVATALAPAFNILAEALCTLRDRLDGKAPTPKTEIELTKKPRKKYARSARVLPGGTSPGGSQSLSGVGQPEKSVVDPSEKSEASSGTSA